MGFRAPRPAAPRTGRPPPRGSVPRAAGSDRCGLVTGAYEMFQREMAARIQPASGTFATGGMRERFGPLGSQRGAALLALVLALALGSGLVTIEWMEAAARSSHAARRTEAALAAARDALIGYAVSYPDQHSGRHGPGYLPCPDTSGNGSPNTPCAAATLGRLPWRRLGLHDPRDGAGERLWYALAKRFRANGYKHRPLNHETAAELVVDGRGGIAAVILAPGPALPFQDRARDRFDPAQYLEAGNEIPGDGTYVSRGSSPLPADRLNDRVAAISREELMAAAAGRALATARTVLSKYREAPWNTGSLPWLAPWTGPAEGALPVPGVTAGRLPLLPYGGTLDTSFQVTGSLTGGTASASGTVSATALGLPAHALAIPAGQCTWTAVRWIDCAGESRTAFGPGRERVFRFDLHFTGDAVVTPPAPADIRRRGVRGAEWVSESRIQILDFAGGTQTGQGEIRFSPGPIRGALAVDGVAYPFGANDEVPDWLLANEWHRSLMVAVAPAFAAGGPAGCGMAGQCLELVRTGLGGRKNTRGAIAIAVLAGPALSHQHRANQDILQWFEGENTNPANLRYEARPSSESFNDQVAAIPPPPGTLSP